MKPVIADSGYFVGLFDPADEYHATCKRFHAAYSGQLVTAWAVFTEVCALLPHHRLRAFFEWAAKAQSAGHLRVESPPPDAIADLWRAMDRYEKLPMDFCDASLVYLAMQLKITAIATVDERDFLVYRLPGNKTFTLVLDTCRSPQRHA